MKGKETKKGIVVPAVYALALGFALSLTGGMHYTGIWGSLEQNHVQLGLPAVLKGIGLAVPAFFAVFSLNRWLVPAVSARMVPGARKISDRAFFFLCWGILLVSWLPYLFSFYPGGVVGDGAQTLEYAIQTDTINSKWGVAQIMSFRLFLALGRLFSPDVNAGIFLYALASCLLYAAVCAAVILTLRKKGVPNSLLILFLFIYAFFGHYASYSISLWKDSLFGAGLIAFSLLLWTMPQEEKPGRAWTAGTGAVMLFLCFWRNFVSWGLLAAGILILILSKMKKRLLALLMILVSLTAIIVQGPVYGALGVRGQTNTEVMAIPLQQVAGAVSEGAELNAEQAATLDRILPLEQWKELYTPAISDSIKFKLDDDWLQAHAFDFLKVWIQLMVRHPGAYVRAWLMETAGFWQPYGSNKGFYYDWFVGVQDLHDRGYKEQDLIAAGTGYSIKNSLKNRLPFIPSGTMVWIMLLCLALLLCRGKEGRKKIPVLLPCLFCWIAVMFSAPIAYSYRYVEMLAVGLPVLACLPLVREDGSFPERSAEKEKRSRITARTAAVLAAAAVIAAFVSGITNVYGFTDGKLEIHMTGDRDNTEYFVREGFSGTEDGFRWTNGDRFTIAFPCGEREQKYEVTLNVAGTFNGTQRYVIRNAAGQELFRGEIRGSGKICFDLEGENPETVFTVELPDAVRISDMQEGSGDRRKVAMKISGIEIRKTEQNEGSVVLPLYGKTVLLAGDSRSSDDYTFYRETLEQKAGCRAVTAGASGRTAAYNASDEYISAVLNRQHDFSVWLVGGNDDGSPGTVGTFDAASPLAGQGEPVISETDVSGDYDGTMFIQAIDHMMRKYLQQSERFQAGRKPVMVFCTDLPQQRDSADSPWSKQENWERKRLAILECCEKNGIICLDLYSLCGFDMSKEPMYTPPTDTEHNRGVYYMDGLHPNRQGIDVITDHEIQLLSGLKGNPD